MANVARTAYVRRILPIFVIYVGMRVCLPDVVCVMRFVQWPVAQMGGGQRRDVEMAGRYLRICGVRGIWFVRSPGPFESRVMGSFF